MHHATSALYDAIQSYSDDKCTTISTYIYVVVERKLLRVINRTFPSYNKTHFSCDSNDTFYIPGNIKEPEVEYNNIKLIAALKDVTKSFPKDTQEIMNYIFDKNYTYEEIARLMGLSYKQVSYKVAKAKFEYKRFLKEHKEIPTNNIDL